METSQSAVCVHRLYEGAPILAPTSREWESGVTFNAAATYLPAIPENLRLIDQLASASVSRDARLASGVVAIHYRARPRHDPGRILTRSYVGLALFTTDLQLLYRFPEPLLSPDLVMTAPDALGVEDPRITRFGNEFQMVYCGCGMNGDGNWAGLLCAAQSKDLLNWKKTGPLKLKYRPEDRQGKFDDTYFDNMPSLKGTTHGVNNKDGVFFPDRINGKLYLLHRPMVGKMSSWAIHLACTDGDVTGEWRDCGPILRATPDLRFAESWVGAGAVPIALGDGRYLAIIHTGNLSATGERLYTLDAVLLNFERFDPKNPESIVESRLDAFMVPTTPYEIEGPYPDSVGNVLFSCGAYEKDGDIYIIYGGGDTYVMAARVNRNELLEAMRPVGV